MVSVRRSDAEVVAVLGGSAQIEPAWLPTYAPWLNPIEKPGTLWVPLVAGAGADLASAGAGLGRAARAGQRLSLSICRRVACGTPVCWPHRAEYISPSVERAMITGFDCQIS